MSLKWFGKNPKARLESRILFNFDADFDCEIDSIQIQNVVLVPDECAAARFMEIIFPHFCELYLASGDGAYPKSQPLNQTVFTKIRSDENLNLVVLGFDSLENLQPRTKKILVLDDLIFGASSLWASEKQYRRDVDEFTIVHQIKSFFFQWQRMERLGTSTPYYNLSPSYDREKLGAILDLFIRHDVRKDILR